MINQVCNDVIHPKDFFQEFKNIEKVVDLFAVGVHEDYKRQGIATKLVEKSMEVRLYKYICTIIITMISDKKFFRLLSQLDVKVHLLLQQIISQISLHKNYK